MKGKKLIALVWLALTLVSAVFILYNGSRTSETSNAHSDAVIEAVKPDYDKAEDEQKPIALNALVRKSAHIIEFALFGAFFTALMLSLTKKRLTPWLGYPLFASLALAALDEFIQSFAGRTSAVSDVWIDTAGAFIGFLISLAVFSVLAKARRKKPGLSKMPPEN